jgi:hypothetical protein
LLKPRAWLRIDEGEYDKYEKRTKKGVMKSQLNELESNTQQLLREAQGTE